MKDSSAIFDEMIALLMHPANWAQHAEARDAKGNEVSPHSPAATSFSLLGALIKVTPHDVYSKRTMEVRNILLDYLEDVLGHRSLSYFNDDPDRKRTDVLNIIAKAKEKAILLAD